MSGTTKIWMRIRHRKIIEKMSKFSLAEHGETYKRLFEGIKGGKIFLIDNMIIKMIYMGELGWLKWTNGWFWKVIIDVIFVYNTLNKGINNYDVIHFNSIQYNFIRSKNNLIIYFI